MFGHINQQLLDVTHVTTSTLIMGGKQEKLGRKRKQSYQNKSQNEEVKLETLGPASFRARFISLMRVTRILLYFVKPAVASTRFDV